MTHASEGLTRAAVDAAAAALGAPGRGLGRRTGRLLDPAVRLAVTNRGVGAPTPWAAPCDEQAFPPAPTQRSRGSIDDGAVPMFDDGSSDDDGASRGPTPSGETRPGRVVGSPFERRRRANPGGLAPGTPSQSWERRESGASPASESDGESAGPGRRRLPRSNPAGVALADGVVGKSVGTNPGTPPRRRPDTAASSQRGGGSRGGSRGGCGGGGLSRTSSAASLLGGGGSRGRRGFREVKTVKNGRNGFTSRERRVRACRVIKCRVSCSSIGSGVNSEERRGEVSRRGDCCGGERRLSRAWSSSWWRSWEPRPRPSPPPRRPRPPRRRRRARRPVRSRPSS